MPLGVARLGEIDFIQVAEPQPLSVQFDGDSFRAALEQLGFDLGRSVQNASDDFGSTNYRWSRSWLSRFLRNFVFPMAIRRPHIFAQRDENGMAQRVLLRPSAELDARDEFRRNPRRFLVCFRHETKRASRNGKFFQVAAQFPVLLRVKAAADVPDEAKFFA